MFLRLDGIFAFAILDNLEKNIFCARDRFGEKPFYYVYRLNQYCVLIDEAKLKLNKNEIIAKKRIENENYYMIL